MVQKVAVKHEFMAGLHHATTVNPAVNGNLLRIREGRQQMERDGLHFPPAVPMI